MIRSRLLFLALAALVVSASAACDVQVGDGDFSLDLATGRAQDSWARSYPLQPGGRFELVNVNGRITAEPSSGSTVEVSSQRTAKASSDDAAKDLLSKVDMREEAGSERVRVEVRAPRTFGISSVEVQWTVKVPKGVTVDLRTVNGKVTLTGLDGEVRAETVNGGVEGTGLLAHTVHATTVNGGVRVGFGRALDGNGQVHVESVNGGVEVGLTPDSRASVVARVTNGGIRHDDLPFAQTGEQSRRRFEGTLNGGGTRVSIETTNGGVRLSNSTS